MSAICLYCGGGPYILGALPPNCLHEAKPRRHNPVAMPQLMSLFILRFIYGYSFCEFNESGSFSSSTGASSTGSACSSVSSTAKTGTGPYTSGSGVNMVRLHDANPSMQSPAYITFSINEARFILISF